MHSLLKSSVRALGLGSTKPRNLPRPIQPRWSMRVALFPLAEASVKVFFEGRNPGLHKALELCQSTCCREFVLGGIKEYSDAARDDHQAIPGSFTSPPMVLDNHPACRLQSASWCSIAQGSLASHRSIQVEANPGFSTKDGHAPQLPNVHGGFPVVPRHRCLKSPCQDNGRLNSPWLPI